MNNPTPEFVKYFAKQVYPSIVTVKVLELFTNLTKKSVQQYISDLITERLKTALNKEDEVSKEQENKQIIEPVTVESKVETTAEEIESFMIIKSILRKNIDLKRITYRDAQTYFAILLDDNNRKPICRLYLNGNKKYLVVLDENKKEVKNEIKTLDDIYSFSDLLLQIVTNYDKVKEK